MPFDPAQCAAPLPRAYQWVDGSAYVNHVELVRKARGAEMPASFWTDPLVYQGGSDDLLGARDDVPFGDAAWGIDLEAEVAVITDDVPMGTDAAAAAGHIKLLALVNDWSLRNLIPGRARQGLRVLSVEARHGVLAGGGDAGRTRRRLAGQQGASAAGEPHQRRGLRPSRCRHRHDVQFRAAHRARDEDAPARRGHHRRIRHGVQLRPQRAARAASRRSARSSISSMARRARRSCNSVTASRSRCSTATGSSIFGALDNQVVRAAP